MADTWYSYFGNPDNRPQEEGEYLIINELGDFEIEYYNIFLGEWGVWDMDGNIQRPRKIVLAWSDHKLPEKPIIQIMVKDRS